MVKSILIIFLVCLFPMAPVFAQNQKMPEIKLGLKFAPNLSFMSPTTTGYSYEGVKPGAVIGLISDFYFTEHYAFSAGLNFSFLGGKIAYPDSANYNKASVSGMTTSNLSFVYIEIPLMLKMFTKKFGRFSFFGQLGFGTGFRIAARTKDEFVSDNGVYSSSEKSDYMSKTTTVRESVIIGLGTEFFLDQSTRLFVGLGYSNSLNNVLKGYNAASKLNQKAYLNYAELNLGIMF